MRRPRSSGIQLSVVLLSLLAACAPSCRRAGGQPGGEDAEASASAPASVSALPLASASVVPAGPTLASIQMQTWIYAEPRFGSSKLGYLRAGAIVGRSETPAGKAGCPGGWFSIKPAGFVCVGEGATLDLEHPVVRATRHRRPDLTKPMPYRYGFIRAVAPQYLRVPTKEEQFEKEFKLEPHLAYYGKHEHEINAVWPGANEVPELEREQALTKPQLSHDVAAPKGKKAKDEDEGDESSEDTADEMTALLPLSVLELFGADTDHDPVPWWLSGAERGVPQLSSFVAPKHAIIAGRVKRHTGLALIGAFSTGPESLGRKFAITTDLRLVPISKLKPNVGSQWHGLSLNDEFTLPLAFAHPEAVKKDPKARKPIKAYVNVEEGQPRESGSLFFRQAVPLTGRDKTVDGVRYFEIKEAQKRWLRKQDIVIARKPDEWPTFAKGDQKWIDLSVIKQTMVLWEGDRPVFATLVSTGQDGIGDPKTTKSTVRGTFRIRDKHVTTTMDANDVGNKFELRDVPWVQYFEAGYALHAAYWHDVYGTPRSHGCINMSPIDARKVFLWTDPPIPPGWHGVTTTDEMGKGTIVYSHI